MRNAGGNAGFGRKARLVKPAFIGYGAEIKPHGLPISFTHESYGNKKERVPEGTHSQTSII
jgi:hypothetical protein